MQPASNPFLKNIPTNRTLLWYKDAVFYELSVRAFKDSDSDGNGDLRGLTEKLGYLQTQIILETELIVRKSCKPLSETVPAESQLKGGGTFSAQPSYS